jgi:ribosome-interacting GTPase 1
MARTGFQALKLDLWRLLGVARVYTKPPGKPVDRGSPFMLPLGSTVMELAVRVHKELPEKLAYARVWGGRLDGQKVARDFELRDRDVVELAT